MSAPPIVFLFSAPYCGGSLLAAMLGRHPGIYAVPELNVMFGDDIGDLFEISDLTHGLVLDGLFRAIAQLHFNGQGEREIREARDWLEQRRDRSIVELLRQLQGWALPRRLLVPDTQTPLRPMDLQRCSQAVPDAQYLHLTRHPLTQGCLLAPVLEERLFVPVDYKDHSHSPPQIDPQIPWLRANQNLLRFAAQLGKERFQTVTTESIEIDADTVLTALCSGWGLTVDESELAWMRNYRAWAFWPLGPHDAPHGLEDEAYQMEDAKYLRRAKTTPTLTGAMPWKRDGSGFASEVCELAAAFGYR